MPFAATAVAYQAANAAEAASARLLRFFPVPIPCIRSSA
jgi:hypothetical protein